MVTKKEREDGESPKNGSYFFKKKNCGLEKEGERRSKKKEGA